MSNETKSNNLNYLIDPAFTNILFVLPFEMKLIELLFRSIIYQKLK